MAVMWRYLGYRRFSSSITKQVYLYGSLDFIPTMLSRGYGMAWGVGGWLMPNFLAKAGMEVGNRLRARVAKELTTTFASLIRMKFLSPKR